MNTQEYVLPPPTLPHGRLSQSAFLLAEPADALPMQVFAGGIVSVVVVDVGMMNFNVVGVVVGVVFDSPEDAIFLLHVALTQYSSSSHAAYIVPFRLATQTEPSGEFLQEGFSTNVMMLLPLHLRYVRWPPQSAVVEHFLPPPPRVVVVVGAAVVVVGLEVVVVGFNVVVDGFNVAAGVCVVVVSCRVVVDVEGASAVEFAGGFSPSRLAGDEMQPQRRRTEATTSGVGFIG